MHHCEPEPACAWSFRQRHVEGFSVSKSGFDRPIAIGLNETNELFLIWILFVHRQKRKHLFIR
jgi:hypothetical protein